nr:outer membrane beta-barrel protein [Haloferula luteola]
MVYQGSVRRLGNPTAELGAIKADRTEDDQELRFIWRPKEKLGVQWAAGTSGQDYDGATLSDSRSNYLEAALEFAYSPKTSVTAAFRSGRAEVEGSPDQTYQQATLALVWKPREKWSIHIKGGVESRDYAQGGDTHGIVDARVEWQPREGTTVFASAYQREEVSAVFAGQNIKVAGLSGGVRQKLGRRWVASLEAGWESSDYKQVAAGAAAAGRRDEVMFVRPSVEYSVSDDFRVGVGYRYERNTSNNNTYGYDNHQVGVELQYDF